MMIWQLDSFFIRSSSSSLQSSFMRRNHFFNDQFQQYGDCAGNFLVQSWRESLLVFLRTSDRHSQMTSLSSTNVRLQVSLLSAHSVFVCFQLVSARNYNFFVCLHPSSDGRHAMAKLVVTGFGSCQNFKRHFF